MQEAAKPCLFILQLLPSSAGPKLLSLVVDIVSRDRLLDLTRQTFFVHADPKAFSFNDLGITFWTLGGAAFCSCPVRLLSYRPLADLQTTP